MFPCGPQVVFEECRESTGVCVCVNVLGVDTRLEKWHTSVEGSAHNERYEGTPMVVSARVCLAQLRRRVK